MENSGQHHAPAALPTPLPPGGDRERTARYPLNTRLSRLQSQSGRTGEDENLIRIKKTEEKKGRQSRKKNLNTINLLPPEFYI
jgi:hypothetical protein